MQDFDVEDRRSCANYHCTFTVQYALYIPIWYLYCIAMDDML